MEDIMKNDIKFAVLHVEESTKQSIIRDTFTFIILALCVWVSKESAAWTTICIAMFVLFGVGQIFGGLNKETKKFKTKAQLQEWVDSL